MYNIYTHPNSYTNYINILDPVESGKCLADSVHAVFSKAGWCVAVRAVSPSSVPSCSCISPPILAISSFPALKSQDTACARFILEFNNAGFLQLLKQPWKFRPAPLALWFLMMPFEVLFPKPLKKLRSQPGTPFPLVHLAYLEGAAK